MRSFKKVLSLALASALLVSGVVAPKADAAVKAKKITLKKTLIMVKVKKKAKIQVKSVTPKKAGKAVTYTINKKGRKYIKINKKGVITALNKKGIAKVTVRSKSNKKVKKVVTVLVAKVLPKKVKLSKTKASLVVSKKLTLKATLTPAKADKRGAKWSTTNAKVAKVTQKGVVTAVKAGTANIRYTTANGKKGTCKVTVTNGTIPTPTNNVVTPVSTSSVTVSGQSVKVSYYSKAYTNSAAVSREAVVASKKDANGKALTVNLNAAVVSEAAANANVDGVKKLIEGFRRVNSYTVSYAAVTISTDKTAEDGYKPLVVANAGTAFDGIYNVKVEKPVDNDATTVYVVEFKDSKKPALFNDTTTNKVTIIVDNVNKLVKVYDVPNNLVVLSNEMVGFADSLSATVTEEPLLKTLS